MTKTLQFKRYANTILATTTGADGELIIDTNTKTITVHDGSTAGGKRIATETFVANSISGISNALLQYAANTANTDLTIALASFNEANIAASLAQSAFNQANSANILAQAAFNQANTGSTSTDVYARTTANTASNNIVILFGIETTQNNSINTVTLLAQAAFNQANTGSIDSFARTTANTASSNTVYLSGIENTQNNSINTVTLLAQSSFNTANLTSNNITVLQGEINSANANVNILFGIENTQNNSISAAFTQANTANILAQAAFNQANTGGAGIDSYARTTANTAASNTVYLTGIETTQNTNINTAITLAQAAFNQANVGGAGTYSNTNVASYLTNYTGNVSAGNVTVTNSITANYIYTTGSNGTVTGVTSMSFSDTTVQNTAFQGIAIDNTARSNANSALNLAQAAYNQANVTAGGLVTANANTVYLSGALATANANTVYLSGALTSANANVSILFGIETTQNNSISATFTQANTANILAQSAFNKANNALPLTGGTITGDVNITGNIIPTVANTYTLGTLANPFQSVYVGPGSLHIGGITLSNNNGVLTMTGANDFVLPGSSTPSVSTVYNSANSALTLAQAAFNQANTGSSDSYARTLAQAAFDQANTGGGGSSSTVDQFARDTANAAYSNAGTAIDNVGSLSSTVSELSSAISNINTFQTVDIGGSFALSAVGACTINFIAGTNMTLTACNATKSITFASSGGGGGGGGGTFDATAVFAPGGGSATYGLLTGLTIPSGYTSSAGFILLALDFSGGSVISAYDSTANHAFTQHYWSGGGSTAFQLTGYGSGGDSFSLQTTGNFDQVGYGPGFVVTSTDLASSGSYTSSYSWSYGSIAPSNPGLYTTHNYAYGYLPLFSSYGSVSPGLTAASGVSMYLDSAHNGVWFKVPGTTWASGGPWATYPGNPGSSFYMTTMFFGA